MNEKPKGKPKFPPTVAEVAQVASMAAAGWSQNRIARSIGKSRHMVGNILKKPEVQRTVQSQKVEIAELCMEKGRAIITSIGPKDIDKASLQQKSIAAGVMIDKSLLLAGEPTAIQNISVLLDVVEAIKARKQLATEPLKELPAEAQ
jgi:alpha-D-ribose 1-methylphosphonate 5-triphosphate synthase subunit PhnL